MTSATRMVWGWAFGTGRTDAAILAVPMIPAAVLVDGVTAAGRGVRQAIRWARRTAANGLRAVAEGLDPLPVADPVPDVLPLPVVLPMPTAPVVPMPAAAQRTEAPAFRGHDGDALQLAALLGQHGSVRATAKALGIAESTLRGRLRKLGIATSRKPRS